MTTEAADSAGGPARGVLARLRPPDYDVPLPLWLRRVRLGVHYALALAGALIVAFMLLSVNYLVFMRYVLRQPPSWVVELNAYVLVFLTFLTIPWIMAFNEHIRIDVLAEVLPARWNRVVEVALTATIVVFLLVLAVLTAERAWTALVGRQEFVGAIVVPKFPFFAVIPVGCVLMALEAALKLADDVYKLRHRGDARGLAEAGHA